ncbi:DUF7832 domain-containing protein [Viridibacillus soli]
MLQYHLDKVKSLEPIYMNWDCVLADNMLNNAGIEFANEYFNFETGLFSHDYEETFPEIESLYNVAGN